LQNTFNELLKECYHIGSLCENEQKEYYLILKYQDKVSERLLKRQKELLEKGSEEFGRVLRDLINAPNPILKMMISKESGIYHQPVILGLEHGVTFANSGEEDNGC